jgi:catechol-2,3-dioxygenase
MGISRLGHVGIHCNDLERTKAFYRDVVGLSVTDEDPEFGMVFLSSHPDDEHHELLLCGGRSSPADTLMLQQIAFRCERLEDVIEYYRRFKEHAVPLDMVMTHGNAVGIYFYDPEGNRCEVYWPTGLAARQPFLEAVDLLQRPDEIMARVKAFVDLHGETGHVDTSLLAAQDIG